MTSCNGCVEHAKRAVDLEDRLRRSRITDGDTVKGFIAYGYESYGYERLPRLAVWNKYETQPNIYQIRILKMDFNKWNPGFFQADQKNWHLGIYSISTRFKIKFWKFLEPWYSNFPWVGSEFSPGKSLGYMNFFGSFSGRELGQNMKTEKAYIPTPCMQSAASQHRRKLQQEKDQLFYMTIQLPMRRHHPTSSWHAQQKKPTMCLELVMRAVNWFILE